MNAIKSPDEAAAFGAVVQAILAAEGSLQVQDLFLLQDLLLLDVSPLATGLDIAGGSMTRLSECNTTVPTVQGHIEMTFDMDANGILNVSAQDRLTCKSNEIIITSKNKRPYQAEMVQNAAKYRV